MSKQVGSILRSKGNEIWSVTPDSTVYDALKLMAGKEIGAVLVLQNQSLVGIFSERDYARKLILHGKHSKETKVGDIMSTQVIYASSHYTAEECMALMTNKRVRHLPVIDEGKLTGIISIGDVVKAVIEGKQDTIDELEDYIIGRR